MEVNPFAQFVEPRQAEVNPFAQFVEPRPEDQSSLRSVADVPLKAAAGVASGVRMIADAFGAGSETSNTIKGVEDWIGQFYSAQSKLDTKEMSRLMDEAKDKGALDNVKAAIEAFKVAPIDTLIHGLGTAAPAIIAAIGTTLAGAPVAIGAGAVTGIGMLMGAGTAKSSIYDSVKEELKKTDLPEAEIEAKAKLAQEYGGKNLDMILMGIGIGGLAGRTGLEGSMVRQMSARILGKAAAEEAASKSVEQVAKQQAQEAVATAAKRGILKQGAVTAGKEFGTEFVQGAQEQVAGNVALQREGFEDTPTFRGAVGAGALEGLAGAGLGASFGAREGAVAKQEQEKLNRLNEVRTVIDQTPNSSLPVDEQTAELASRYATQMPQDLAEDLATKVVAARVERTGQAVESGVVVPDSVKPNAERVVDIEDDYIASGVPPAAARAQAILDATEEAYNDYLFEQGEKNAARTDTTAGGASVPVAPESIDVPAGGPTEAQPTGVVSTPPPTGVPDVGEGVVPTAVAPTTAPTPQPPATATAPTPQPPATATAPTPQPPATATAPTPQPPATATAPTPQPPATPIIGEPSVAQTPQAVEAKEAGAKTPAAGATAAVEGPTPAAAHKKRGRPALTEEQRAVSAEKQKIARADSNKNNRALVQAEADLKDLDLRSDALHVLKELRKTPIRAKAQAVISAAGVTPEEARKVSDTHAEWLKAKAEDVSIEGKTRRTKSTAPSTDTTVPGIDKPVAEAEYKTSREGRWLYTTAREHFLRSTDTALLRDILEERTEALKALEKAVESGERTEKSINWETEWDPQTDVRDMKGAQGEVAAFTRSLAKLENKQVREQKQKEQVAQQEAQTEQALWRAKEEVAADVAGAKPERKKGKKVSVLDQLYAEAAAYDRAEEEEGRLGEDGELKFQGVDADTDLADTGFSQLATAAEAASYIANESSNNFQSLLAKRLTNLRSLQGVKFVVVEKGKDAHLDSDKNWKFARGVFDRATNTIYIKGDSFGGAQGINNTTVLHELLHAALHNKIEAGRQATDQKEIRLLFNELNNIRSRTKWHFKTLEKQGKLPPGLYGLLSPMFANADEFLSYGMSDPTLQEFLKAVPGVNKDKTAFSSFVGSILKFLGLSNQNRSALTDLIDVTDRLISYKGAVKASKTTGTMPQAVNRTLAKVQRANTNSPTFWNGLEQLTTDRNPALLNDILSANSTAFKDSALRQLLPTLQTETLIEWAGKLGLNNLVKSWGYMKDMNALRVSLVAKASPISEKLVKLQSKDPKGYETLGAVMHYSTLRGVDPSTKEGADKGPALKALWQQLSPETQQLYKEVRDYYKNNYDLYHHTLLERVENSGVVGENKDKLIAAIKHMYEAGLKNAPYFPLMRYGQFWVRIGKGKAGKFYMFESQPAKEVFIKQWYRDQDQTTSLSEMYQAGDIEDGNSINDARKNVASHSELLKNLFDLVDKGTKKRVFVTDDFGNQISKESAVEVERLKDDIYQLMLHTLPDKSFRKRFIHRKGKEGFSKDISRNFATLSTDMAAQLARLKYSPQALNAIESAKAALAGNPEKARLGEFVTEMRMRVEAAAYPDPENSLGQRMATFANTTAFLWMMSNVKTAVAQFSAVPVFLAPVLASRYGIPATAKALGRFLPVWNSFGAHHTDKDGRETWVAPTIAESKTVKLNAEEQRAAQYMIDRGISETTLAYDLGNRKTLPTEVQNSVPRKVLRGTVTAMTALFHHVEKLNREMAFVSAFRLERAKNPDASFETVAREAEKLTNYALGNFSSANRPRGVGATAEHGVLLNAHKPLGRAVLQFKMFPAFVTTYFVRNFWRMIGSGYTKAERKEAATQFFGSMGMSLSIAGVMGVPGFSLAMGVLSGLRNLTLDEDDEDDFVKRDLQLWFRNIWLPQTFGNVKIGGKSLADLVDRGAIAALTGFDISSSLSLNNMWFPEHKEQATAQAAMTDYFTSILGPFASLGIKQLPKAIDSFNQGKLLQGVEQLLPAMARSPLTAYRYSQEGATTVVGAPIKEADEFTRGQLIGQALGFTAEGLVAERETIFAVNAMVMRAKNEKRALLARLGLELQDTDGGVDKALEKIDNFNRKNWFDAITGDSIDESLRNRMKRQFGSERGLQIEPKYYPMARELFDVPIEKLEREAERARK